MFSALLLSTVLKLSFLQEMKSINEVQLIPPVSITAEGFKFNES